MVTFLWVLCASALDVSIAAVTSYQGLQEGAGHYALLVTTSLLSVLLFTFDLLYGVLGGASFNPTDLSPPIPPDSTAPPSSLLRSSSVPPVFSGINRILK